MMAARTTAAPRNRQKFFGSFFQKRTASPCLGRGVRRLLPTFLTQAKEKKFPDRDRTTRFCL
jgi:hypothetical protein